MSETEIIKIKNLSKGNYILRLKKKNFDFKAGQFFSIGLKEIGINREYSVANSAMKDYIDFFIREIEGGSLTSKLRNLQIGSKVQIHGPFGEFYLTEYDAQKEYIFIATGTGLAPFISLINTFSIKNYKIFHGVRYFEDVYNLQKFNEYNVAVSREEIPCKNIDSISNIVHGRVGKFLENFKYKKNQLFFLCGNSKMVSEIYDKLINKEIKQTNIFTEIFF